MPLWNRPVAEQFITGLATAMVLMLLGSFYIDWKVSTQRVVMRFLVWQLAFAAELWYVAHTLGLVDMREYSHEIDRIQRYKLRWQLWLIDHEDEK